MRSSEAAKEIKVLVSSAADHVAKGVGLVNDAGESLGGIVHHVAEISQVVQQIATASKELATALREINTAINQMDQMTQQNAAMVEESTAATTARAEDAQGLASLMRRFDVGGDDVVTPLAARRPAG